MPEGASITFPPLTKLNVLGHAWMGMLNDIIHKDSPRDFNDAKTQIANCPSQDPGGC